MECLPRYMTFFFMWNRVLVLVKSCSLPSTLSSSLISFGKMNAVHEMQPDA